jgi:hypothetical protein
MPWDKSIRGVVMATLFCGGCGAETPPATTQNPAPVADASLPGAAKDTRANPKKGAWSTLPVKPKSRENPSGH